MKPDSVSPVDPCVVPGPPRINTGRTGGWTIVVALFALALVAFQHRLSVAEDQGGSLRSGAATVGAAAPDFHFIPVALPSAKPVTLSSIEGHPLWLNFFATWCTPCKAEMPEIEQRYVKHKKDGLRVLGVDQQELVAAVREFGRARGLTFPLAVDPGEGALMYDISAIPTSVFVDTGGTVRAIYRGQMSAGEMDSALRTIHK